MSAAPKPRSKGSELGAVDASLREAADELERDLLELMAKVGLSQQLVEDHGMHWAWLARTVGTPERLDWVLRQHLDGHSIGAEGLVLVAVEHAAELHRATHPHWPVRAVTYLVNATLLVHQSRGSPSGRALTELLHAGRFAGAAAAEIDGVFPRSLRIARGIAREQYEELRAAEDLQASMIRAEHGRRGAEKRHEASRALGAWAIAEGRAAGGLCSKAFARALARRIPADLNLRIQKLADPERTIHEALRAEFSGGKHKA